MTSFDTGNPVFTPSDILIGMVHQALVWHAINVGIDPAAAAVDVELQERAVRITGPRVVEIVASRARRTSAGVIEDRPLIAYDRFNDDFANEVFENIPLSYSITQEFFEQLRHEIAVFLAHGGEIAGTWGRLTLNGGSVSYELPKAEAK